MSREEAPAGTEVPAELGRYRVERRLRAGAMGEVYLGVDPVIGRRVVLKTVRRDLLTEGPRASELVERFRRECRILGSLAHPNVVTMFDAGEDPATGVLYMAMEHVEGVDLHGILSRGTRFPPEQAREIALSLARALQAAHAQGIVHRDLKPSNVMMAIDGTVKLTDFGIARDAGGEITRQGVIVGTPSYQSPEQVQGKALDGRSDLYSLGVILHEILTGQKPPPADGPADAATHVPQRGAEASPALPADVPPDLALLVERLLARRPEDRPAGAEEVVRLLEAPGSGETPTRDVTAVAATPTVRLPSTGVARPAAPRLGPALALLSAVLILAALTAAGLLLLVWQQGRERPTAEPASVATPAETPPPEGVPSRVAPPSRTPYRPPEPPSPADRDREKAFEEMEREHQRFLEEHRTRRETPSR